MLRKLLKHEFRATGRFMWVIYLAMLVLSVAANVSMRMLDRTDNSILNGIMVMVLVAWVLTLIIGGVMITVLLIQRFYKNLLTDEGYLMFTLPTTVHHLVLSKLIVTVVWFLVTMVAYVLCVFLAVVSNEMVRDILDVVRSAFAYFSLKYAMNGVAIVLEVLLLLVVSTAVSCLQFYGAMSIGYGFTNHKGLWSVASYFVFGFVLQILAVIVTAATSILTVPAGFPVSLTAMQTWHLAMLGSTGAMLVLGAVFYIITVLNLQKRLNLS
ncbi:MAG: hypothetical protein PUC06_03345 [Oscillospiraceae bacterium]|nr:hypothetical protein [Oscillospiraceae bacterium]